MTFPRRYKKSAFWLCSPTTPPLSSASTGASNVSRESPQPNTWSRSTVLLSNSHYLGTAGLLLPGPHYLKPLLIPTWSCCPPRLPSNAARFQRTPWPTRSRSAGNVWGSWVLPVATPSLSLKSDLWRGGGWGGPSLDPGSEQQELWEQCIELGEAFAV